ncbi:MAG: NUDIX domain-containing protein [Candidatus Altiarchaeota archaeon]|nr:NUDIX domain-containing protein [Candidatus Altiarchaeota archaeon]
MVKMYEKKHFAVTVYMFNKDKEILLIKHPKLGVWLPPGGHLEKNELPTEGASREVLEEIGMGLKFREETLDNTTLIKSPDYTLIEDLKDHNHIDLIYVLKVKHFEPTLDNEIHDHRWASIKELKKMDLFENTRTLIKRILSEKF